MQAKKGKKGKKKIVMVHRHVSLILRKIKFKIKREKIYMCGCDNNKKKVNYPENRPFFYLFSYGTIENYFSHFK